MVPKLPICVLILSIFKKRNIPVSRIKTFDTVQSAIGINGWKIEMNSEKLENVLCNSPFNHFERKENFELVMVGCVGNFPSNWMHRMKNDSDDGIQTETFNNII